MTKSELTTELFCGKTIGELFQLRDGQECTIFKTDKFTADENICYIPDLDFNHIPTNIVLWKDEIEEVVSCCYTGNDFVEECGGDEELAERLFWYCDWQHPCSAIDEVADDEKAAVPAVSGARAMTLLRGVATWMSNNIGVDSAIGNLFWLGATPDEAIAIGFDEAKVKSLYETYDDDALPWI